MSDGDAGRPPWMRAALLVGVVYFVAGVTFAALAGRAESHRMVVTWRLAAWVISAAAFALHIGYEHVRGRSSARTTAWRAALADALGAFGLAVAANVHALAASSRQHSLAHVLSLILWPVMTALPAFLVAWAAAAGLSLVRRGD